tara:strand:- start:2422 stop:2625 length:204 start_codon:yes stop_codon:yes gene_type:complete
MSKGIKEQQSTCTHIFLLPEPNGKESLGKCKVCGVTKMHYNSYQTRFNGWKGENRGAKASRKEGSEE